MKTHSVCLPLVATLALSVAVAKAAVSSTPRGVSPSNAHLYVPDKSSQWKCLDGSKTIPFSAVNDDYCDCKDGSDEPGTSACGNGYFNCANVGHVSANIKSSRVNDGVCDAECCDGSDEFDGTIQCPNVCEQVGAKAREEQARIRAIEEQGSRLRKKYSEHGKSTKIQMKREIEELRGKTDQLQKVTEAAKEKLDKVNEKQDKYFESTKGERDAARKAQLAPLIEEQTRRLKAAKDSKNHLIKTLQNVKDNHNKNYHDLAVKNTVSGFDEFLTRNGDVAEEHIEPGEDTTDYTTEETTEVTDEETVDDSEDTNTDSPPEERLKTLIDDTTTVLRDINTLHGLLDTMKREYNTEYNDEAVLAAVKVVEDFDSKWDSYRQEFKEEPTQTIPEEPTDNTPEALKLKEETDKAQGEYDAASDEETSAKDRIQEIETKLNVDFGPDEAFAQLLDECFDYNDIDKFSSWEGTGYNVQLYTGGTRCWNGPDRSVRLEMSCGIENKLVSVSEPAKCEYLYKMETPAVCPELPDSNEPEPEPATVSVPPPSGTNVKHDEL
ncbi:hypothetical protein BGX31_003590 [Mortierella sp. GBA43]|nr:hypothetical protein BGX31_003590 [Mortierella sp. GBA43]